MQEIDVPARMNISVKGEYALAGHLRSLLPAARDSRSKSPTSPRRQKHPAKISGADPRQPEAGRLRRIAARRRRRLSAGAAARPDHRRRSVPLLRRRAEWRSPAPSANRTRHSPICGSQVDDAVSGVVDHTTFADLHSRLDRKTQPASCQTGRSDLEKECSTPIIRSASAARRWCG